MSFKLKNLKSSIGNNKIIVLPANTKRIEISKHTTIKKGKYGFSSSYTFNYGDHYQNDYDEDFEYYLPFQNTEAYKVDQGYNGSFSHQNENAIDFTMPVGTKIVAARGGIVIKVVDINYRRCEKKECEKFNNKIIIYHNDGTFAEYTHIKKKGAKVKAGDVIQRGQLIAESGNVGYSTGPHLHFVVFFQKLKERKTLKTKFKINDGTKTEFLVEKKEYLRNYN